MEEKQHTGKTKSMLYLMNEWSENNFGCTHHSWSLILIFRRSSIHGTPTHGMGTILNNSSILQASHILEQTASHLIQAYGSTLPVVVTEILTISESKFIG